MGGRTVLASRLGYRITALFADRFLGRIFETPDAVFPEEILRPEKQDMDAFAAGVDAIVAAQKRVAENYFYDGSVDARLPAAAGAAAHHGRRGMGRQGRGATAKCGPCSPAESVLGSDWYQERLRVKQERDMALWSRHIAALEAFAAGHGARQIDVAARLAEARAQMARVSSVAYLSELVGTIGAEPSLSTRSTHSTS